MKFDYHYLFTTKYARWIVIALISLFSLLIVYEWASFLFSASPADHKEALVENDGDRNKEHSLGDLANLSLFGVYVPKNLNNVKKSMLDVTLVGILFADNIDDSQVIIRSVSGEELNYRLGDLIPGDALIKRITTNGVLVERNGALESLSLPKNDLIFEPIAKPLKEDKKQ